MASVLILGVWDIRAQMRMVTSSASSPEPSWHLLVVDTDALLSRNNLKSEVPHGNVSKHLRPRSSSPTIARVGLPTRHIRSHFTTSVSVPRAAMSALATVGKLAFLLTARNSGSAPA